MEIAVIDRQGLLSTDAVNRAKSRVNAAFARFGDNVQSIHITVLDTNGSKGGVDKECRVLVKLKRMNDITVTTMDESLSKAIPGAINRAARSVGRSLDRRISRDSSKFSRLSYEA